MRGVFAAAIIALTGVLFLFPSGEAGAAGKKSSSIEDDAATCQKDAPKLVKKHFRKYFHRGYKSLKGDFKKFIAETKRINSYNCLYADFDGDGKKDYAFLLTDGANEKFVVGVAMTQPKGGTAGLILEEVKLAPENVYLTLAKPKTYSQADDDKVKVKLRGRGVIRNIWQTASILFYWRNGSFKELWIAD